MPFELGIMMDSLCYHLDQIVSTWQYAETFARVEDDTLQSGVGRSERSLMADEYVDQLSHEDT